MNKLYLLALLAVSLVFTGCSSTQLSTPTAKVAGKIAVQYATIKVLKNNPTKAQALLDIAKTVKAVAGTEGFDTVDALIALIKTKVDFSHYAPEDAFLANSLIDLIGIELKDAVGAGRIPTAKLPAIAEVASWVEEQARLSIPTT